MKYTDLVKAEPVGLNRQRAAEFVGSEVVLDELLSRKLVRPKIQRHKLTIFDRDELIAAFKKLPDQTKARSMSRSLGRSLA